MSGIGASGVDRARGERSRSGREAEVEGGVSEGERSGKRGVSLASGGSRWRSLSGRESTIPPGGPWD